MVKAYIRFGMSLAIAIGLPDRGIAQPFSLPASTPIPLPPDLQETVEPELPTPLAPLPNEPPTPLPVVPLQLPRSNSTPDLETTNPQFQLRQVEVIGSTVLQPDIAALVQPLEGQMVTFEDLVNLRSAITQLYINEGYVTSGAFIPNNQDLSQGVVQIRVIEGTLEQIEIAGLLHLREAYVRDRITRAASTPLNQQDLVEALQLLQLNPLIQQVNAELTAGSAPGRNILLVTVQEADPFQLSVNANNYRSPSVGSEQISLEAAYTNILGLGDRLSVGYGVTEGLDQFQIGYAIPLNAQDGTLTLAYNTDQGRIVEEAFAELGIRSDSNTYSIGFRQPLWQTPTTELALGLGLDLRRNQTFIAEDEPFSFSEGADNGVSNLTVVRFSQEWVDRTANRVFAARSQFSLGINAFDATVNDSGTDGRFFSWLGQFQYVQQLSRQLLFVTRLAAQLTPDSLLSVERFGFGGTDTVRGYRQNQLVTDNGVLATVEARISLFSQSDRLQLIPFVDIGHGWNNDTPDPSADLLASVGLGFRWLILPRLAVQLEYGIPLTEVNTSGNSLQDRGFSLSINYLPF